MGLSMSEFIQVLTAVDRPEAAQAIAKALLENRLAACVQIWGPIQSLYWWQGKIEKTQECLMLIKSLRELYSKIEETIRSLHPYHVPEILALPILEGDSAYLQWLKAETQR